MNLSTLPKTFSDVLTTPNVMLYLDNAGMGKMASLRKSYTTLAYSDPLFTIFSLFQKIYFEWLDDDCVPLILNRVSPLSLESIPKLQQKMAHQIQRMVRPFFSKDQTIMHKAKSKFAMLKLFLDHTFLRNNPHVQTLFYNKYVYRLLSTCEFLYHEKLATSDFFLPSLPSSAKENPAFRDLFYLAVHTNVKSLQYLPSSLQKDVQENADLLRRIFPVQEDENLTLISEPLSKDKAFIFFALRILTKSRIIAGFKEDQLRRFIHCIDKVLIASPSFWIELIETNLRLEPLLFAPATILSDPSVIKKAAVYGNAFLYADPLLYANPDFVCACLTHQIHIDNFNLINISLFNNLQFGKSLIPYLEKILPNAMGDLAPIQFSLIFLNISLFAELPDYQIRLARLLIKFIHLQGKQDPYKLGWFIDQINPSFKKTIYSLIENDCQLKTDFLLACFSYSAIGEYFEDSSHRLITNLLTIRKNNFNLNSLFSDVGLCEDKAYMLTLIQVLPYPTVALTLGKKFASNEEFLNLFLEIIHRWIKNDMPPRLSETLQSILRWSKSPSFTIQVEAMIHRWMESPSPVTEKKDPMK